MIVDLHTRVWSSIEELGPSVAETARRRSAGPWTRQAVAEVDELMIGLNEALGITTVIITHEMTSAFRVAQRMVLMHEGRFVADGTPDAMKHSDVPLVRQFVNGLLEGPLRQDDDGEAYRRRLLEVPSQPG